MPLSWIRNLAASSKGVLASVGDDLLIKFWDLSSGQMVAQLGKRRSSIRTITQVSPMLIVTEHRDRTVRLHTANFRQLERTPVRSPGSSLGLSPIAPELTIAVTLRDGRATISEIPRLKALVDIDAPDASIHRAMLLPNRSWLACGGVRCNRDGMTGYMQL